ncbi:MAG: cyclic nucleotide-binding protein [Spirochaetae bacterium HGW-Spirochaetae-1]|jgi:CRP-like cAMP-binding protein|nr:MAG: cyclic nucleotide-binding protein [Spirochaetae bacterium HGW-Spirochaetae-1]
MGKTQKRGLMASSKHVRYFQKGERIIREGHQEQKMYIILEGNVVITLDAGGDEIEVAKLKKGDFFGEISLFEKIPRSATATAQDNVKVVFIENEDQLKEFLLKNPSFAAKMVHILAKRLAKTDKILIEEFREKNKLQAMKDMSGLHYFLD